MEIVIDIKKRVGDFNLKVHFEGDSSRIGILGISGSGKSMTLKCIAGIEVPDEGYIRVGDNVLFDSQKKLNKKPQNRNIGYLFQNYALFPTMTVAKNIEAGLKGSKPDNQKRVQEMIEKFQLTGLADRLPGELSGGQQQRVALARIMAYEPDVILLDEPFSAMDIVLKDRLQQEMMEMLAEYKGIVILVSHDKDEIYRFSDELLVMDEGTTVTYGMTKEIFADPSYKEAAKLIGYRNFSKIRKIDAHTIEAKDWGIILHVDRVVPEDADCIGYHSYDFIPVWGERHENCLEVQVRDVARFPMESNYYLVPEGVQTEDSQIICWSVRREENKIQDERKNAELSGIKGGKHKISENPIDLLNGQR